MPTCFLAQSGEEHRASLRLKRKPPDRALINKLLDRVGLAGFENKMPRELSGGMQQRASIVRSLSVNPSLLLMYEPFGALDAFTRDEMNLLIQEIWMEDEKTIAFVTHSIAEAIFLADRVAVMSRTPGRIAAIYDIRHSPAARHRHPDRTGIHQARAGNQIKDQHGWDICQGGDHLKGKREAPSGQSARRQGSEFNKKQPGGGNVGLSGASFSLGEHRTKLEVFVIALSPSSCGRRKRVSPLLVSGAAVCVAAAQPDPDRARHRISQSLAASLIPLKELFIGFAIGGSIGFLARRRHHAIPSSRRW